MPLAAGAAGCAVDGDPLAVEVDVIHRYGHGLFPAEAWTAQHLSIDFAGFSGETLRRRARAGEIKPGS